jgi:hypothetical protein
MVTYTTNYDHSHANGVDVEGVLVQDKLFDEFSIRRKVTIASGQGLLGRGTALGKITTGAATSAAKAGGNTGNGTVSAITASLPDKVGIYKVRFTAATVFTVLDPSGNRLADGATGVAYADVLGFTIAAGGTAYVAGDGYDLTVATGSGKWVQSVAAATDGSQIVRGILLHPVDATSADADGIVGRIGTCNGGAVILGAGHTLASIDDGCIDRGLILETIIGA